jgi:hypothetical protein
MLIQIGVVISILVPFVFSIILWSSKPKTGLEWLVQVWFTVAYCLFIYLTGRWDYFSYYLRYFVVFFVATAILRSFLRIWKKSKFYDPALPGIKTSLLVYLVPTLLFTVLSIVALRGLLYHGPAVSLAFPLKEGTFYMAQAGGTTIVNAHHPYGSQIYALDIVRLDTLGRRAAGLRQSSLEQYTIFGTPIYSPCEGLVFEAVDGLDDHAPGAPGDTQHAAGNHIFLTCQGGIQVLLAHMKKGSLTVTEGAPVETGDLIGLVGNSGNSSEPHLHIHAQKDGRPGALVSGTGMGIQFEGRFLVRNDVIKN